MKSRNPQGMQGPDPGAEQIRHRQYREEDHRPGNLSKTQDRGTVVNHHKLIHRVTEGIHHIHIRVRHSMAAVLRTKLRAPGHTIGATIMVELGEFEVHRGFKAGNASHSPLIWSAQCMKYCRP